MIVRHYEQEKEILAPINLLPEEDWVVIVPTRKKIRFLQEELDLFQQNVKIATIPQLMYSLYQDQGGKKKVITPLEQELILEMVCLGMAGRLSFFELLPKYPGTVKKLRNFFSLLVQDMVSLQDCQLERGLKQELADIQKEYKRYLERHDLIDIDALALEVLAMLAQSSLLNWNIILDTLYYRTALDEQFLALLFEKAKNAYVYLDFPFEKKDKEDDFNGLLDSFHRIDFGAKIMALAQEKKYSTFAGEAEEVKAVAQKIRALLEEGAKRDNILVIPANFTDYQPLIAEIFPLYGLPVDFSRGIPLAASPMVLLIKTILDLLDRPYNRRLLSGLFSSGLISYGDLNIEVIDEEARRLNYNNLALMLDDVIDDSRPERQEWQRQARLLQDFIVAELIPLREAKSIEELVKGLLELLKRLNIVENIMVAGREIQDKQIKEDFTILNKICEVFTEIEKVSVYVSQERGSRPHKIFKRLFEELTAESEYYLPETQNGIHVTNLLNLRGWKGDYLFFLGAVEGDFPQMGEFNFLMADRLACRQLIWEGELNLYCMFHNAQKVFITMPLYKKGKQSLCSPLLATLTADDWVYTSKPYSREDRLSLLGTKPDIALWKKHADSQDVNILKMQIARQMPGDLGSYDGVIGPYDCIDANDAGDCLVEDHADNPSGGSFRERVFSVSQIEDYNRCPMLYFFKRILRLQPREKVEEDMESIDFGNQIHAILENFGKEGGFNMLPDRIWEAGLLLKEISYRVLAEYGIDPAKNLYIKAQYEKWWYGLEGEPGAPGVFHHFLKEEAAKMATMEPFCFEYIFGPQKGETLFIGPYALRGRIDRIDRSKASGSLIIYDYKTGRFPSKKEIVEKESLQLPIYLFALQKSQQLAKSKMSGIYYRLHHREKISYSNVVGDKNKDISGRKAVLSLEELGGEETYIAIIEKVNQGLQKGYFPFTDRPPRKAGCRYCDYRLICRYDYSRIKKLF